MLVHDLRTPLTGIVGYAHLAERLAGQGLDPDARDSLVRLKDLAGSLVEMVSAIAEAADWPAALARLRAEVERVEAALEALLGEPAPAESGHAALRPLLLALWLGLTASLLAQPYLPPGRSEISGRLDTTEASGHAAGLFRLTRSALHLEIKGLLPGAPIPSSWSRCDPTWWKA